MKIRKREKIPEIILQPSDVFYLAYKGTDVMCDKINRTIVVDEVVIFDVEEGDFEGVRDGIGGVFLSIKERDKNEKE